jgi:hypothetical protein
MSSPRSASIIVGLGFAAACAGAACDAPPVEREPTLTAIRADIFNPRCSFNACHGGTNPVRGLDLQNDPFGTLVDVVGEEGGIVRVVPGEPEESLLFQVLQGPVGATRQMPPGVVVDDADIEQVRAWIAAGAADD